MIFIDSYYKCVSKNHVNCNYCKDGIRAITSQ